tara:strand:+ start:580 stop:714 length:135 start_codon:yes stop_codon:yes gene_type:complete
MLSSDNKRSLVAGRGKFNTSLINWTKIPRKIPGIKNILNGTYLK